jgi:hypothetical protein
MHYGFCNTEGNIDMRENIHRFNPVRLIALFLLAVVGTPASALQSVTLVWGPSTSASVAGYNIYYGGANGDYTNMIPVGNVTNVTVTGLLDGTTYYFAAKAVNASGTESGFSNQTSYSVPTPAASLNAATHGKGGFGFVVNGVPGYKYVVEASTDMINWTPLETNTVPFSYSDPAASQFSRRFYRTVYLP